MKNILSFALIAIIACPPSVFAGAAAGGKGAASAEEKDPLAKLKLGDTPFEMCQDRAMIPTSLYNEDKEYWDTAMKECSGVSLEVMPDAGFFQVMRTRLGNEAGGDEKRAVDFLRQVGAKAEENIDGNIAQLDSILECAQNAQAKNCEEKLKQIAKVMKEVRPGLRQGLALAQYGEGADLGHESADPAKNLNGKMRPLDAGLVSAGKYYFPAQMEALSADETEAAADTFAKDLADIKKKWDEEEVPLANKVIDGRLKAYPNGGAKANLIAAQRPKAGDYSSAKFEEYRKFQREVKQTEHRDAYFKAIQEMPLLAYLNGGDAADGCLKGQGDACRALAEATKKVKENSMAEKGRLDDILHNTVRGKKVNAQKMSDLLPLMKYGPAVRELLEKDKNSCGTATGLVDLLASTKTRDSMYILGGTMAGFIAGGWLGTPLLAARGVSVPMAAVASGAATAGIVSGGLLALDASNANKATQGLLSAAETKEQGKAMIDVKEYEEAKDALAMNIALSPTVLWGTGIGKVALGAGATALGASIGNQFMKSGARSAISAALKEKGHSEQAIAKIFADLGGKDAVAARKATQTLMHELGMEDETLAVMRKAASKGLISSFTQKAAAKAIREDIKNAPMAKRVMEVLEEVNPAKINEGNRQQVLEASLAGSKFGVKEPKYLAAKINDWEQGLDGLTATFQLAEKKMGLAEVRGLASEEARQEKAFRLALKEQIESNPEMKAISKAEKDKMIDQMATCGLKGK